MKIFSLDAPEFKKYGRIVGNVDFRELAEKMKDTPIPNGVIYEPSVPELEKLPVMEQLSRIAYGEMPIQIGYCNGHNEYLNGLEYHRSSEINVAGTDAVLLLGLQKDIEQDYTYDTSRVEAFLVPAGTGVELYASTLHYAPCGVRGQGFQMAVVLPKGTNGPLQCRHSMLPKDWEPLDEDALLTAVNKWLIGHPKGGIEGQVFLGLKGENIKVC